MFTLLEEMPVRRDPKHLGLAAVGALAGGVAATFLYLMAQNGMVEWPWTRTVAHLERQHRHYTAAEEACRAIAKPEGFESRRQSSEVGANDSVTVVYHYRSLRPPHQIRAFFLATLRPAPTYDPVSETISASGGYVMVRRLSGLRAFDFEVSCRSSDDLDVVVCDAD